MNWTLPILYDEYGAFSVGTVMDPHLASQILVVNNLSRTGFKKRRTREQPKALYAASANLWRLDGKMIFHPSFLGQFGRQVVHHIQPKITLGGLPLSGRMSFTNKTDDLVVYFFWSWVYLLKLYLSHEFDLCCTWA